MKLPIEHHENPDIAEEVVGSGSIKSTPYTLRTDRYSSAKINNTELS